MVFDTLGSFLVDETTDFLLSLSLSLLSPLTDYYSENVLSGGDSLPSLPENFMVARLDITRVTVTYGVLFIG